MNTYQIHDKTYLIQDGKLFVEVSPVDTGSSRDEKTTAALRDAVVRTHAIRGKVTKALTTGKQKRCGNCGKPGHQRRTCSEVEARLDAEPTQSSGLCVICNSPEHVTKDCDGLAEEIDRLRGQGLDSLRIAATLKIRLSTINENWPALTNTDES
jgi:hypothetical protein